MSNEWDKLNIDKIVEKVDEQKREANPKTDEEKARIDAARILRELRQEARDSDQKPPPEKTITSMTKLKKNDFRVGLRFAKCCMTCQYFFSLGYSNRGWCHYPSHYPRLSRRALQSKDLDKLVLEEKKWQRTHPMLTCDLWKRMTHKKLGRALDWVRYDTLPVEGELSEEENG